MELTIENPVVAGDTIHAECEIVEARRSRSRPGRGLVRTRVRVVKQDGATALVYTPLRERHWYRAVAASNAVGLVIDSAAFLWLAFSSFAFLAGQIVGKVEVTVAFLLVAWAWRSWRSRREPALAG